jgi:murein DD-endopeptidase / murein LD-carboxypeptidase
MKQTFRDISVLIIVMLLITMSCAGQTKELSTFINEWMGVKYRFGAPNGGSKKGIDCSQFTKKLYGEVYGVKLGNNCQQQWNQTKRVERDSLMVGDILFFRSKISPSGWHCGLYLGNGNFVHAANRVEGVKISSLTEPRYDKNFKGAGRIKFYSYISI